MSSNAVSGGRTLRTRGFTIVELLIVVVVIAILAAITLVAYNGIRERATSTSMASDLSNNSRQLEIFQLENNRYPSTVDDATWISNNLIGGKDGQGSNGTTYQYFPSAALDTYTQVISKGDTLWTNSSTNNTPVNPSNAAPPAPTASALAVTSFKLSWTAVAGASAYNVTCARNTALTTTPVTTASSTINEYSRTGMNAGTIYYCNYQPTFGGVNGTASTVSSAITTPTPAVPAGLAASAITGTSFKLTWTNVTGAYRYNLQCALSTDTAYASPVYTHTGTSLSSGTTGVTISTGLTESTSYICRVASKGYNNASAYSANITVTTAAPAN